MKMAIHGNVEDPETAVEEDLITEEDSINETTKATTMIMITTNPTGTTVNVVMDVDTIHMINMVKVEDIFMVGAVDEDETIVVFEINTALC